MKVKQNPPWWHIIVGKLDPFCLKPSCPEKSIGNAASSNACWTWRKCPIWSDWPVALRIGKLVEPHHLGNIINSKCVQIPSKESSGRKTRGFEFWTDSGGCKHLTVCIFCSWSILLLLMELPSRHLYSCRTSESGRVRKRRIQSCRCDRSQKHTWVLRCLNILPIFIPTWDINRMIFRDIGQFCKVIAQFKG